MVGGASATMVGQSPLVVVVAAAHQAPPRVSAASQSVSWWRVRLAVEDSVGRAAWAADQLVGVTHDQPFTHGSAVER
jgi:hypothetical protein